MALNQVWKKFRRFTLTSQSILSRFFSRIRCCCLENGSLFLNQYRRTKHFAVTDKGTRFLHAGKDEAFSSKSDSTSARFSEFLLLLYFDVESCISVPHSNQETKLDSFIICTVLQIYMYYIWLISSFYIRTTVYVRKWFFFVNAQLLIRFRTFALKFDRHKRVQEGKMVCLKRSTDLVKTWNQVQIRATCWDVLFIGLSMSRSTWLQATGTFSKRLSAF